MEMSTGVSLLRTAQSLLTGRTILAYDCNKYHLSDLGIYMYYGHLHHRLEGSVILIQYVS